MSTPTPSPVQISPEISATPNDKNINQNIVHNFTNTGNQGNGTNLILHQSDLDKFANPSGITPILLNPELFSPDGLSNDTVLNYQGVSMAHLVLLRSPTIYSGAR